MHIVWKRIRFVYNGTIEDVAPEFVNHELTESCHSVISNGNGACAIHVVVGKPDVAQ